MYKPKGIFVGCETQYIAKILYYFSFHFAKRPHIFFRRGGRASDFSRRLGGSDVGFAIPEVGASVGPNLTPDKETGLGAWTDDQIVAALTKGVTPDGRKLSPVMPWQELAALSPDDAKAIVAYLRSLPPVKNAVPGPFGPDQTPSTLVFVIVPGAVYAKMPKP